MTGKSPKDGMHDPEARYRDEDAGLSEAEMDAWGERNKDALRASFEKARAEYARGEYHTLEEVMAELEEQAKRRQKRKAK